MATLTLLRDRAVTFLTIWRFRLHLMRLSLSLAPAAGADGDPNPDPDPKPDPDPNPDPDPDPKPDPGEPDWKAESRKHEKRAKTSQKEVEQLKAQLKEREDESKSEQEKALEKAREEAKAEGRSEVEKDRRHDRLDIAATKAAVKGIEITVKEGDEEKTRTVKFADPDDALIYVEKAIKDGEVDESDIFDDEGKVQTEALAKALGEILEKKPHLGAGASQNGSAKPTGKADVGRGSGGGTDLEAMSVEDHVKAVTKTGQK